MWVLMSCYSQQNFKQNGSVRTPSQLMLFHLSIKLNNIRRREVLFENQPREAIRQKSLKILSFWLKFKRNPWVWRSALALNALMGHELNRYILRVIQTKAILCFKLMSEKVGSDIQRRWNSMMNFLIDYESIEDDVILNWESFYVGSDSFRHWFQK